MADPETDMVERAAIAARQAMGMALKERAPHLTIPSWEDEREVLREEWLVAIRAAILAMEKPTTAMRDAAEADPATKAVDNVVLSAHIHGVRVPDEFTGDNVPLLRWWRAMIRAAVEEPKHG